MIEQPVTQETRNAELVDARIAAAWAHDALMEHASIGSFARFTLELLAVGAPPRLLIASHDAGRDEVQHAQKCFTIASRFAGKKLGPGPLDVSGVSVDASRDLAAIVEGAVEEGCVAETYSALLAQERSKLARDPELSFALAKIAKDEQRHSDLAWSFLDWAVGTGGEPVRQAALHAFEKATAEPFNGFNPVLRGLPTDVLHAYGLLDEATALAVARCALAEVIGPRVDALRTSLA